MKSSDSPTRATPPQWVNTAALNIAREFYAQEYSESDHARLVSIIVSALAEASCEATPPPQADRMPLFEQPTDKFLDLFPEFCASDYYNRLKADPVRYEAYLEQKRQQRKARQEDRNYETERKRRWRANNPEARKRMRQASNAVEYALKTGRIVRPKKCSACGKSGDIEAHHHKGYAKKNWLEIVWLCVRCHRKAEALTTGDAS